MNESAIDLKKHLEQKDISILRERHDFVYVMLDKRIDELRDEIKDIKIEMRGFRDELKGDMKGLRDELKGDIDKTNQKIDALAAQTTAQSLSMKMWGIGIVFTILLATFGPLIVSWLG